MSRSPGPLCLGVVLACCMLPTALAAVSGADRDFLVRAMQSNVNEIALSTLAAKRAVNPDVKRFAEKLAADHKVLEKKLRPFAMAWSITVPTQMDAAHLQAYRKLRKLRGPAFDKQYMAVVYPDHNNILEAFTHEANVATDVDFKATVISEKSVIAAHTNMADDLNGKL
jgi:putative membrane protein